jgi:hypothetical protein
MCLNSSVHAIYHLTHTMVLTYLVLCTHVKGTVIQLTTEWLRKSNLIKEGEDPIQAMILLEVARLHATHYLSNGIKEFSV